MAPTLTFFQALLPTLFKPFPPPLLDTLLPTLFEPFGSALLPCFQDSAVDHPRAAFDGYLLLDRFDLFRFIVVTSCGEITGHTTFSRN